MNILKKENWWIWLILFLFSSGTSNLVLGALLDVYDKDAWYARWTRKFPKWLFGVIIILVFIGFLSLVSLMVSTDTTLTTGEILIENVSIFTALGAFIFLIVAMFIWVALMVFYLQILCLTAARLNVSGSEFYLSPYVWILCLIIPIFGWIFLSVMLIYLNIANIIMVYRGNAEKYIK